MGMKNSLNSLASQPSGPTTQVSALAVLTSKYVHCSGVPTRISTADQVPSSPYLRGRSVIIGYFEGVRRSYQLVEGVTLKAVGVAVDKMLWTRRVTNTVTLFHHDTEFMVNGLVAFFSRIEGLFFAKPRTKSDGQLSTAVAEKGGREVSKHGLI